MTPARKSPSTRTLGIQLVAMSTVLALIARIFLTASRPLPVIATSRNATTTVILARMENLASIFGNLSVFECVGGVRSYLTFACCACVNSPARRTTERRAMVRRQARNGQYSTHQLDCTGEDSAPLK